MTDGADAGAASASGPESLGDAASHFTAEALGEPEGVGRYVNVNSLDPVEFVAGLGFRPVLGQRAMTNFVSFEPGAVAPKHVHEEEQIVASRALYERRAGLTGEALARHMPEGTTWTKPQGGFYYWLTAPDGVDTVALSTAAREKKVAYVPGRPFYPGDEGHAQIRISYSRVDDELIDEGIRRIGGVLKTALEGT